MARRHPSRGLKGLQQQALLTELLQCGDRSTGGAASPK